MKLRLSNESGSELQFSGASESKFRCSLHKIAIAGDNFPQAFSTASWIAVVATNSLNGEAML